MQVRIPLFSAPTIVRVDGSDTLALLDLRDVFDQDVIRYVTLYAQSFSENPTGTAIPLAQFFGEAFDAATVVNFTTLTDNNPTPVRVLDQYPVRGDVILSTVAFPTTPTDSVMFWGFYTIGEADDQRTVNSNDGYPGSVPAPGGGIAPPIKFISVEKSNALDKRPLQPDNEVPTFATASVEAPVSPLPGAVVHEVPADLESIDEVTVDVCLRGSTSAQVYFEDFPDNFINLLPITIAPNARGSSSRLQRALDGIPFRGDGSLLIEATVPPDEESALASGFFVRY